jgi:lipopolysaccharide transport system permease protein
MWHNLGELLRYRGLIHSLVVRDLKARYRGSVLGFFWSFVNPLMLLSIYTFVFTHILQNNEEKTRPYAVFMFCGLLPWTWFSSSLLEASGSLISGGNLIKKVLFPAEVLPFVSVLTNMVHFFLGLLILAGFMVYTGHYPNPVNLPWFPLVVIVQLIFTLALALILSALTVHFRDIRDLLANLLTFWFFATPIIYFYQMESVQKFKWLFNLNPFFHLSVSYQEILFFHGDATGAPLTPGTVVKTATFVDGHLGWLLVMGAASCALFVFGYWLFDRLRDSFAEVV